MTDLRSSLQIFHEEHERIIKANLSSNTELHFGFHVLRDSKLGADDIYETELLSRETNSIQSLPNAQENDAHFVFDSIEQFIPEHHIQPPIPLTAQPEPLPTPQLRNLSNIPEVDGESESTLSRLVTVEDQKQRNSNEKLSRPPKADLEEHLQTLSRDFAKREKTSGVNMYNHYNNCSGNLASKLLASDLEGTAKFLERSFRPTNSESAPDFHHKSKRQEFDFEDFSTGKHTLDLQKLTNGWAVDSNRISYKNDTQGLFSQALEKVTCSPDLRSNDQSVKKRDQPNDSFENLQLFENSAPNNKDNHIITQIDESRFQRRAIFAKKPPCDSPVIDPHDDLCNQTSLRMNVAESIERAKRDALVIVNTESLDYSHNMSGDKKLGFKKRTAEEKIESEGTFGMDTDRQPKSVSSNAPFHKSSVKAINLRDSTKDGMFVRPDSMTEQVRGLLSVRGNTSTNLSRRLIKDTLDEDACGLLSGQKPIDGELRHSQSESDDRPPDIICEEPTPSLPSGYVSPKEIKSVTAKVTELSLPNDSGKSRRDSRSPSPNHSSKCKERQQQPSIKFQTSPKSDFDNASPNLKNSFNKPDFNINCNVLQPADIKDVLLNDSLYKRVQETEQSATSKPSSPKMIISEKRKGSLPPSSAKTSSQKALGSSSTVAQSPLPTPDRSFRKAVTPLKTITQLPRKATNKSPIKMQYNHINFGSIVQKHVKNSDALTKIPTDLFRNHFSNRVTDVPSKTEDFASNKSTANWGTNSAFQEHRTTFDKARLFNGSAIGESRKSCTPNKSKSMIQPPLKALLAEEKERIGDQLLEELAICFSKQLPLRTNGHQSSLKTVISDRKGIRVLRDLRLIDQERMTKEDCRLVEIMMTTLDPFDHGKLNLREFKLFVLAMFGIERNDHNLEDLDLLKPTPSVNTSRPSVHSAKLFPVFSRQSSKAKTDVNYNTDNRSVQAQQTRYWFGIKGDKTARLTYQKENHKSINDNVEPVYVRYFEMSEIERIEREFKRFRDNRLRAQLPTSFADKQPTLNAISPRMNAAGNGVSSANSICLLRPGPCKPSTPIQTIPYFPNCAFKKQRETELSSAKETHSMYIPRPSTDTNAESGFSVKSAQRIDHNSDRNLPVHLTSRSRSPLCKADSVVNMNTSTSRLKKNYSLVNVNTVRFLPFVRDNNREGNILKLEIVIGPEQVEDIYILREDPETIDSKLKKLQRKCRLDERQTEAIRAIINREVNDLQWPVN